MTTSSHIYTPSDLVLVTGANGHIAQHVVDQLLALPDGPRVRATIRSEAAAKLIRSFYEDQVSRGRLEVLIVPDIVKAGAFDDAVQGATHIAHIASPLIIGAKDIANDLLYPAIQGTVGVLESALKSPSVKAVVVTSSIGAMFDAKKGWRPGYTYSATDWNPTTFEEAASPDLDLNAYPQAFRQYITYIASKVLAEKAAWDFHRTHSPHFALSTILPTYTGGPSVLPITKGVAPLSFTQELLWKIATEGTLPELDWPPRVDVRDVAKAHVNALILPEAAGKRWLLSSARLTYSEIADIIRRNFPAFNPSTEVQKVDYYDVDASEALSALGLEHYINFEQTVVDTIKQVQALEEAK